MYRKSPQTSPFTPTPQGWHHRSSILAEKGPLLCFWLELVVSLRRTIVTGRSNSVFGISPRPGFAWPAHRLPPRLLSMCQLLDGLLHRLSGSVDSLGVLDGAHLVAAAMGEVEALLQQVAQLQETFCHPGEAVGPSLVVSPEQSSAEPRPLFVREPEAGGVVTDACRRANNIDPNSGAAAAAAATLAAAARSAAAAVAAAAAAAGASATLPVWPDGSEPLQQAPLPQARKASSAEEPSRAAAVAKAGRSVPAPPTHRAPSHRPLSPPHTYTPSPANTSSTARSPPSHSPSEAPRHAHRPLPPASPLIASPPRRVIRGVRAPATTLPEANSTGSVRVGSGTPRGADVTDPGWSPPMHSEHEWRQGGSCGSVPPGTAARHAVRRGPAGNPNPAAGCTERADAATRDATVRHAAARGATARAAPACQAPAEYAAFSDAALDLEEPRCVDVKGTWAASEAFFHSPKEFAVFLVGSPEAAAACSGGSSAVWSASWSKHGGNGSPWIGVSRRRSGGSESAGGGGSGPGGVAMSRQRLEQNFSVDHHRGSPAQSATPPRGTPTSSRAGNAGIPRHGLDSSLSVGSGSTLVRSSASASAVRAARGAAPRPLQAATQRPGLSPPTPRPGSGSR